MHTNDRFFEIAERLRATDTPPNTDTQPVCYKYSSMIWLSKFVPTLINRGFARSQTGVLLMSLAGLIIATGLFALIRSIAKVRRAALVAVAGFAGMVMETVLILHYQVKSGVLYQDIGVLLTLFMTGLAVGSAVVHKTARYADTEGYDVRRMWGYSLLVGFAVLNAAFVGMVYFTQTAGLGVISLLLFLTGFLVAGVFAYASLAGIKNQKAVVSPLYAADLIGGCIGSLAASLLLIPFLGMLQSAALVAILSIAALLLV
jgi:hypothetical protein